MGCKRSEVQILSPRLLALKVVPAFRAFVYGPMNEPLPPTPPLNRNAAISLFAAILTVVSFCTAVAPIPLTGYVCYPGAVLFGLVAVVFGVMALVQIRSTQE